MKQTLEEVANSISGVHPDWSRLECFRKGFKEGAKWHAKQSPWISVRDKAGCDTSDDCVVMTKNFEIFKAYFSSENKWMKYNNSYYDEVIEDVICWMPIPSFDEILEANRVKEKGD